MLFSLAMLAFEVIYIFLKHVVNVYLLNMFCANAARTLQRKENHSMVFFSVEESYLYLSLH